MSTPILQLDGLCQAYGDTEVLHGIDLDLPRGEFVALIGPNGSGKSSLLQCIAGILEPCAGRVLVDGIDMANSAQAAKQRLGYAVDPAHLPARLTGRECLQLFAGARGLAGIPDATLTLADTLALAAVLDKSVDRYSLGMRQKLAIGLGMIGEPPLLLLDESLNGLDPASAHALKRHLRALAAERGTTIVLATHSLELAEHFVDRVLLLVDGRLLHGWNRADLDAMRSDPGRSLEQAMIDVLAAGEGTPATS